ncbi:transposase domain-containing protein, partial [Bradyrhizobium sp. LA2.1]|uniref:transposase domain-containing protein n=1 Tax=Bradyrhizobium sp. LA2.1 TaxID=3156376 RepID=UPI0033918B1A
PPLPERVRCRPRYEGHPSKARASPCGENRAYAERALRGIALGRRNWTFAGSLRGADRAAIMLTMITTCRLNDVDPKAWLADVLARIADLPASRLHELLPWEWKLLRQADNPTDMQAA